MSSPSAYSFGLGTGGGAFLGLGPARLATLGGGLLTAVGAVLAGAPLPVAAVSVLAAAVVALTPLAGRPLLGWVAPVTGRTRGLLTGTDRWVTLPTLAAFPPVRMRLPREFGPVRVFDVQTAGRAGVGVAAAGDRTVVAFTVAGGQRLLVADADEQDQVLGAWGLALSALATDAAHVQLLTRATPAASRPVEDREAWVSGYAAGHETYLALSWPRTRSEDTTGRVSTAAGVLLRAQLATRPLTGPELTRLLDRVVTAQARDPGGGPVSRRVGWDHVRVDDAWHRSYAVAVWPRSPVPAAWLHPLLTAPVGPAVARTVAIHLQPLPRAVALRRARAARAQADLDRTDRARLGMVPSVATDRADDAGVDLEADLVAGHAAHRLAAVITLTAGSLDALDDASRGLGDAAAGAYLDVRPLHGQHHLALAATVPLTRLLLRGAP